MKTMRARLPAILFLWGFLLGIPFYHIPTFTKGPLICALIGQEKNVFEIFTQPHLWTYRPLLVLMFSTLYKLFGFHYEPYRIFASLFSGFFALFVYLFLLELHPSRKIAFFATIIFTLTTPFLDGLWDLSEGGFYSTCLFYGAFLFFVKLSKCDGNHKLENRYTFLFLLFSLLSLLIKETTRAMAPPILFLYCYFLKANKTQWKLFWIFCGLSVLTLLPVLSAPPEPGSRAAITTPFWEVAKIAFQINVTQLMSVFHISIVLLLLIYGVLLFAKPHITRIKSVNQILNILTWIFLFAFGFVILFFFMLILPDQEYISYFSAKYFPQHNFLLYNAVAYIFLVTLVLIFLYGSRIEKLSSSIIVFIFFSYYTSMTFIPAFRLEPSSRHYLVILPFFCFLAALSFEMLISVTRDLFAAEKVVLGGISLPLFILFTLSLIASAMNLKSEFTSIGKSEFSAWASLSEQGLRDTVVFSPADGYALPPEYLKLASPNEHYAFFQLPRWFATQADFESYLRRTINENNLQSTRKIFYYSGYDPVPYFIGDSGDRFERPRSVLDAGYKVYNKIGYWYHVLSMHGVLVTPQMDYLSRNAKLVYGNGQQFIQLSADEPSIKYNHQYLTRIYIMDNEQPKPK